MTYCDFQVGDQVVCVRATEFPWQSTEDADPVTGLVEGQSYTVRFVGPCGLEDDYSVIVRLVETSNLDAWGRDWGYLPIRFRKVQRRKTDLSIEAFLTIKPGFEEPKRAPAPKKERVS